MVGPAPAAILVIDDDRSARLLLERVLLKAGHQVTLVETAAEGLRLLTAGTFQLLVTDKNLPDLDGLEVVRRARALHPALRVMVMTGFPTEATRVEALKLGVDAYVSKPFGVHDMLELCLRALRAGAGA